MADPPLRAKSAIYSAAGGASQNTQMKMPVSTRPPRITRPTQYRQAQDVHQAAAVETAVEAATVET